MECSFFKASSLLEISCAYIVKDAALTRLAIDSVPTILRTNLMEAALIGNHDRSIQALMSRWSLQRMVLSHLVPSVFTSLLPLYQPTYQSDLVRQGRHIEVLSQLVFQSIYQAFHRLLMHFFLMKLVM